LIRSGLILLILVSCLLAASTWRVFGHTWDEPEHLAAGMELLDQGKYEFDTEHPPLARALMALGPHLAGSHSFGTPPPDGTREGLDILYDGGHYDRTLMLARLGTLPFLAVLLLAMWLWAREVAASDGEALLGVLLLATVPPIIGHAALAALDIPGTATTLLALYLLQRWLNTGLLLDSLLFGLAAGVAFTTKLSAIPFIGLGLLALLLLRAFLSAAPAAVSGQRRGAGLGLMVVGVLVPVSFVYGYHGLDIVALPPRFNWVMSYLLQNDSLAYQIAHPLEHMRLPAAWWNYAEGVMALKAHNDTGHMSFLLGNVQAGGWWYFYLVALAVKTPLPLLLSGLVGFGLLARDGWREANSWRLAPVVLWVTVLAFASLFSRINIGIRHVLILYPFLALGGAYSLASAWRKWPRVGSASAALLVTWQVGTLVTAYPDYFPYFNETVSDPQHVLVDSDLDWGQDLRRLERRLIELKVPAVSLAYEGSADLRRETLPAFVLLQPNQPTSGWIAVTALAREHAPAGFAWLSPYRPVERVGKTIDLYFIAP
jgi:4-amino-4-deoxy-L-arabinose transferase-like glycosyltransferase